MGFSKMIELLQIKNKGKIVLANSGTFYIAIGRDAVLLNELLGLKVTCMSPEICKVGFPIISLEKYTDILQEKGYSFIVYYFNRDTEELEILIDYEGKHKNNTERQNINCYICKHSTKYYKADDKYVKAVARLYAKENKELQGKEENKKEEKKKWYKISQKKKKTN